PSLRPAAAPSTEPGEFTRMFHSPMPDAPAQGDWPPAAAKPPEPGEFTEFFKPSPGGMPVGPQFPSASQFPQAAPGPAPPPAQQATGGEYTRMFGPGSLSGAPGPVPAAPPAAPPPAPPASYGPGGSATQAFRVTPGYKIGRASC